MTSNTWAARALLVVLIILAFILLVMIIRPFASGFFIAAVLAGAFHPWQVRLTRRLKNRRMLAAGVITLGVVVALVLPLGALGAIAVKEALEGITYVRSTLQSEGVQGLIQELPQFLQNVAQRILEALPEEGQADIGSLAGAQSGRAVAAVGGVLQATSRAVLQTVMMLIAFFFLLTDGSKLVAWASSILPLRRVQFHELLAEFRRVSVAVLYSSIATAGVQALVAAVGYVIARVPNAVFFTLVTFFVGMIPAVGAASVSLALALLVFLGGHPWAAAFLAAWGVIVVGLVDNVVKPLLIRGGLELHGAIVFFSLLGGLAAFGGIGLLAGPLIVAFFLAMVSIVEREFGDEPTIASPT
jgi:predicted PurR-regulated permease PerM